MITYTTIHTANNDKLFYKIIFLINNYKYVLISLLLISNFFVLKAQDSFLDNQLTYSRFSAAYQEKNEILKSEFEKKNLTYPPKEVLLIAYKAEGELQMWVKEKEKFELFKVYDVCQKSGDFGPKKKQGDMQVPEGFYYVNIFNPVSSFHLSLGITYPNKSDKIISTAVDLGGDIYIHGDCVTIGCLPMTDYFIKEIYLLCALAKNENQNKIPIQMYPFKFNKLAETIFYKEYPEHISFWNNLKSEYLFFQKNKMIRNYTIDSKGKYLFYE